MSEVKAVSKAKQRKAKFRVKLERAFLSYNKILMVTVDNVGSKQLQQVRASIRGRAELMMGKNTMVRKTINDLAEKRPDLLLLLPQINGNLGFLFLNDDVDLKELRDEIISNVVPAAARPGSFGQRDVIIPAGVTPLDPGQTSFFQAMNIATKIVRGAIEIITPVILIRKGERVSSSAVALLSKLELKPFEYGVLCTSVFDNGSVYSSKVLDLTDDDLKNKFIQGARHVAAVAMAMHYPCAAAVPHLLINSFKHCAAIALEIDYQFPEMQRFKDYLDDPSAFASAAPAAATADAPAPEPEPEEEEEEMDFDLFG